MNFISTAKGSKGDSGERGPKGIRGRQGRPGPAIYFDSSESVITIKGEKVNCITTEKQYKQNLSISLMVDCVR